MIFALAFIVVGAASVYSVQANTCNTVGVRPYARINNKFGKNLLNVLSNNERNVFFSPSSLSSLLSAIFSAARGKTITDLDDLSYLSLQYENVSSISPHLTYCLEILTRLNSTSDDYTLERANALLFQKDYPILEQYKQSLFKKFGTLAKEVNFLGHDQNAIAEINKWVREKTRGKIPDLVDRLPTTHLMFLSAIYFKGTWQTEFDPEFTKPRPFYNNGNASPKSVPTMSLRTKLPFMYDSDKRYRALQLPYKGGDISMLILLPFDRDGIERMQQTITYDTIIDVLERVSLTKIIVYLPKFKVHYSKNIEGDLSAMGLGAMFSADADFSGITGRNGSRVTEIFHSAVVEVNEEGSEAAAASGGAVYVPRPAPKETLHEFIVDHPFIFFIVDNRSRSNLFVGRVNKL